MKRHPLLLLIMAAALALPAGLAGCSSGEATGAGQVPAGLLFRADSQGEVSIDATWDVADDGSIVFDIIMNTHSVPLDGYDLSEVSVLRDSTGTEYRPTSWDSAPGGHHRRGMLTFPTPEAVTAGASGGFIELVIRDIAGISERTFRWDL